MSSAFRSFDDDDDSLLISPTVDRVRSDADTDHDRRLRFTAIMATATDQRGEEFDIDTNDSILDSSTSTVEDTVPTKEESFALAQTPQKLKFNYASALEELEFLAPTPAPTEKKDQRRQMHIQPNYEEEEESLVVRPSYTSFSPPSSPLTSDPGIVKATTLESDELETDIDASSSAEHPNPTHITHSTSSIFPTIDSAHAVPTTATQNDNDNSSEPSVFRQPCLRKSNSNESLSLELNLGHPVNESYDIAEFHISSDGGGDHLVKDSDLSMEVEKRFAGAQNYHHGLVLEESSRVDKVDMKAYDVDVASELDHPDEIDNYDDDDVTEYRNNSELSKADGGAVVPPEAVSRPWDIMDSDDSETNTTASNNRRQSGYYVEKMNESIASYFSSHGGTIPPGKDDANTNVSLEFSADLDDSLGDGAGLVESARPSSHENQQQMHFYEDNVQDKSLEFSISDGGFDGTKHDGTIINLPSIDNDASIIDDDETLDNVGQIQSCHQSDANSELGDEGEDNVDASQGFLFGEESINEDEPECEPIDDPGCAPLDRHLLLRTGADSLDEKDSLLATDIGDLGTSNYDGARERERHSFDNIIESSTSSTPSAIADGMGSILVIERRGQHSENSSSELQIEHLRSEDIELSVDDDEEEDIGNLGNSCGNKPGHSAIDGTTCPTKLRGAREGASNSFDNIFLRSTSGTTSAVSILDIELRDVDSQPAAASGASPDEVAPILKSSSPHNTIQYAERSSPELQIEHALSGNELSVDDEETHEYCNHSAPSIGGSASFTERSGTMKLRASDFEVVTQQPDREYAAEDTVDSLLNSSSDRPHVQMEKSDFNDESVEAKDNAAHVKHSNGSSFCTTDEQPPADKCLENKRASFEDLSSYQQNFNSTSNAFLERLREGAELRKREVTRGRHSMERKEQLLSEEKYVRVQQMSMPSVAEEGRKSNSNALTSGRKLMGREDDPYRPFKANLLPATSASITSTAALGAKRKSSTVFRSLQAPNNSCVKSSALNAKPPKRLLAGEDASNAKEMSLRKKIQEEEDKIRRESTFKARPLPVTTRTRSFEPLLGEHLVQGKSDQRGKENIAFIPRSSHRAEERKLYDIAKAEREIERRKEEIEKRNRRIEQTNAEINELKKFLR
ncbi:hypothetical protein ACHAWU_001832 [Discostella pseudostelligera]|uniref:TPX2 C-terminal domain-containing protein n=1 Tax=Discostella pseudostelligera TaxID=259834 RepID=A0ABD3MA66_9STRA